MNPLLRLGYEIPFSQIECAHIVPAVRELIAAAQAKLDEIAARKSGITFANTLLGMDDAVEDLNNAMAVVRHLENVANSEELRAAIEMADPEVSAFRAAIPLNAGLWEALQAIPKDGLNAVEARALKLELDYFRRNGAELDEDAKKRLLEIDVELQQLTTKYSQNVLDSTNAYELVLPDDSRLAGLPPSALAAAKASAEAKGKTGYRFTLQAPSLGPAMSYLEDRALRQQLWEAFNRRSSEGAHDNRELMRQVLVLRREKARQLGYFTFADFILADRMAKRGQVAREFVLELEAHSVEAFQKEHDELLRFRESIEGPSEAPMQPWDVGYYAEKLRKAMYAFDEEALRPYFAVDAVVEGMFRLFEQVLGIEVKQKLDSVVYHPSAKYYEIHSDGRLLGGFFADWFPRESKRGGAWMQQLRTGGPQADGSFLPHLGVICGNMTEPLADRPALLTHREVETIFHEFGHLLHHCLSESPLRRLAGTNVPWDFVELPSQIMENWCWERVSLDFFARHYETGEPIPEELFEKLRNARQFRGASQQMRQLGFALVDLDLHMDMNPKLEVDLVKLANIVLQRFAPVTLPEDYFMILSFTHLFSDPVGYAAGYYSYKWAEVLDADAFSRFQAEGVLNAETGRAFRENVLAKGNTAEPMELFRGFMGRDPDSRALLRRNGLLIG
jgi:oligopeptidase A